MRTNPRIRARRRTQPGSYGNTVPMAAIGPPPFGQQHATPQHLQHSLASLAREHPPWLSIRRPGPFMRINPPPKCAPATPRFA